MPGFIRVFLLSIMGNRNLLTENSKTVKTGPIISLNVSWMSLMSESPEMEFVKLGYRVTICKALFIMHVVTLRKKAFPCPISWGGDKSGGASAITLKMPYTFGE